MQVARLERQDLHCGAPMQATRVTPSGQSPLRSTIRDQLILPQLGSHLHRMYVQSSHVSSSAGCG